MRIKKINKIIVMLILIVLSIVFGTKCVYGVTKKNGRVYGYSELVDSSIANHNVGKLIVLASEDDLNNQNKKNKIKNLIGDYDLAGLYAATLNMGTEYDHTYCVQHNVDNVLSDMRIKNYIKIQGTKMVEHKWAKKENGKWVTKNGSTYNGTENAILAYILANEKNTTNCAWSSWTKSAVQVDSNHDNAQMDGPRQLAIKNYWNTWLSAINNGQTVLQSNAWSFNGKIQNTFEKDGANALNDAKKNYSVGQQASINATETSVSGSNPALKISYVGTISSVTVKDTNNNVIPASNIKYYSDANYTKEISINNIPNNGTSFYIKNTSGRAIKDVEINVKKDNTYQVELWMLESTGYLGKDSIVPKGQTSACQKLMAVKDSFVTTTASTTITYKDQGTININKTDLNNSDIKLSAGFKLYVGNNYYVGKDNNGNWVYNKGFNEAHTFYTTNGTTTINNLALRTYNIYEVVAPSGYDLTIQSKYNETNKYVNYGSVELNSSSINKTINATNIIGSLKVTKKDLMSNSAIKAVTKFKVGNTSKGWLKGNKGSYSFIESKANADLYETKDGILYLDGLPGGTYIIEEVEAPTGYILSAQENTSLNLTINKSNPNPSGVLTNVKLISIRGYAWIDQPNGKQNDTDGIWTSTMDGANGLEGVTVKLMKKGQKDPVATRTTGKDGVYIFENIVKKAELANYYVLFDYSGLDSLKSKYKDINGQEQKYINYIPVTYDKIVDNKELRTQNSKALLSSVAESDVNLDGIATTYAGSNQSLVNKYGLEAIGDYNETTNLLNGINLGLKELKKADYNITENIAYVKIDMKGYTFTYNYGGVGKTNMIAAPTVNWQKTGTISGYTASIYPSDIAYSNTQTDLKNKIKVYVVYRIDIKNTTNYNLNELYVEDKLKITSLNNYYDGNRYTIEKEYDLENNNSITKDFDNWSNVSDVSRNGKNLKKVQYDLEKFKDGLGYKDEDNTKTAFIEFRVNDNAIQKILENPQGIIEEYPTEAEATGYHEYHRNDYSWTNLENANSNPNKGKFPQNQKHITENDIRKSHAPYLIFKENKERTIGGKVFEDEVQKNSTEKLGDGVYNNGENVVEGVKVDLIEVPEGITDFRKLTSENIKNLTVAKRYPKEGNGAPKETNNAILTDNTGAYELVGIVPGKYLLRFTYGDGTQKIFDTNKKEIKTIVGKDYKSTIVKNEEIKKVLSGEKGEEWYKDLSKDVIYSVALDNLNTRKSLHDTVDGKADIMAGTAKLDVTIENTKDKSYDMPENKVNNNENATQEIIKSSNDTQERIYINYYNEIKAENKIDGLSFGIIEQPKQEVEIQKLITNVKLTNTQGNVLYNGNPEKVASQGAVALSDLDNKENEGSTYVRVEMAEDSLYGTNLELTYEVKITNKSDINYYNNEYYWYGEKNDNKEITLTPIVVKDYLDQTVTYDAEKSDKDRIKEINKSQTIQVDGKKIKAQEYNLEGWKTLYTNKIITRDSNHPTTDKVKIVAKRVLSNQDDDMVVISRAEIKDIKHTPDPKDTDANEQKIENVKIAPKEVHTNGMVKATFTITPPTGADMNSTTIYAIAGIISLIILSTGIVIIKKKLK